MDDTGDLNPILRDELADIVHRHGLGPDDSLGFQRSYGGVPRPGTTCTSMSGAAAKAEEWQVLSPFRAQAGGVNELNRLLQRTYRAAMLSLARNENGYARKIPKPAGPQEIVYGDKVINIRNKTRKHYYPAKPGDRWSTSRTARSASSPGHSSPAASKSR